MGFLDTLLGRDAADTSRDAAALQYGREQGAIGDMRAAGSQYAGATRDLAGQFDPYATAGNSALERLMAGLGLTGGGQQFTEAYRALPGYQAGLDSGTRAIDYSAAARGMGQSGRTMKDLYRFGSNYEDQRSGDYLNRLAGLAGSGLSATGQKVNTIGQGLSGEFNANTGAANSSFRSAATEPLGMIAGANAEAAGAQNLLNFGGNIFGKLTAKPNQYFSFGK